MNTFAAGAPTDAALKAAAEEELERIRSLLKGFNLGLKQSPHECIINCFSGQRFFPGNSLNIYQ